ncbi:hypothetical protein [Nakamurella multipartita]|uniref:hypothetical protein n=1 Tax=Nakamurella multipartita TaxID=53461 RepID=UPI00019E8280|nr:hypothetical protein [Nakamurella multipartita]
MPSSLLIAGLPINGRVKWHCDQISQSDPWAQDWVAINVDEVEGGEDPRPWTLALDPPSDRGDGRSGDADPLCAFEWAPDLSLHRVIEPRALLPRTIAEYLSPAADTLCETESAEFAAHLSGNCLLQSEVVPAWSVQAINAGLTHWPPRFSSARTWCSNGTVTPGRPTSWHGRSSGPRRR